MGIEYGNGEWARKHEILRTTVGSEVHGIAIPGTEDHDEMGVYIEDPTEVMGFDPSLGMSQRQDYTSRTKNEGERSGPGDTDLTIYGFRKYVGLCVKGNPTVLLPLFAPPDQILNINPWYGGELRGNRENFLSKHTIYRILGYCEAQRERMMGGGKQRLVPNRPELVEKYGWDTKYGSHALRLAYQAWDMCVDGSLILPMRPIFRSHVLAVKTGEYEREEVNDYILEMMAETRALIPKSPLPDEVNLQAVRKWMADFQLEYWSDNPS